MQNHGYNASDNHNQGYFRQSTQGYGPGHAQGYITTNNNTTTNNPYHNQGQAQAQGLGMGQGPWPGQGPPPAARELHRQTTTEEYNVRGDKETHHRDGTVDIHTASGRYFRDE